MPECEQHQWMGSDGNYCGREAEKLIIVEAGHEDGTETRFGDRQGDVLADMSGFHPQITFSAQTPRRMLLEMMVGGTEIPAEQEYHCGLSQPIPVCKGCTSNSFTMIAVNYRYERVGLWLVGVGFVALQFVDAVQLRQDLAQLGLGPARRTDQANQQERRP